MNPLLKWAGGKRWLVPELMPLLRNHHKRYIEPFLGGGAVAFAHAKPRMILNDSCERLMETYRALAKDPDRVYSLLKAMPVSKDDYYRIRDEVYRSKFKRAAQFIYWNRFGFNGLYRVNQSGKFNVPYGDGKGSIPSLESLQEASAVLAECHLMCSDYQDALDRAQPEDFVFVDPPYAGGVFNGYTRESFDQVRLAYALRDLAAQNTYFICTNADTPEIRELYSWARIVEVGENRVIGRNRDKAKCLVISYRLPSF